MLLFQSQKSRQSLSQGLDEYLAAHPELADVRRMSAEAADFFRRHDVVHVVYGCGTSLDDEAVVKVASIFGSTAGLGVLRGYRLHESRRIYSRLRVADMLVTAARSVVIVPRTVLRCRAQRAPWPWDAFEPFLERPLDEIRSQFGIAVAHRDG